MSRSELIEVCVIRKGNGLTCKDCKYYGSQCERVKHKAGVRYPYEIETKPKFTMEEHYNGN